MLSMSWLALLAIAVVESSSSILCLSSPWAKAVAVYNDVLMSAVMTALLFIWFI